MFATATLTWAAENGLDLGFFTLRYYSLLFAAGFFLGYRQMRKWFTSAGLTNEQLDILISRLSEFERLIFQEYILEDFTYRELSKQTGIPTTFLYKTIDLIKQKIRANVIRKTL